MNLFKQLEDLRGVLADKMTEATVIATKMKKGLETLEQGEFDELTENRNLLEAEIKSLKTEIAQKEAEYNHQVLQRKELISTQNANLFQKETPKNVYDTPDYMEAWAESVKTGKTAKLDKLLTTTPNTNGTTANAFGVLVPTQVATEIEKKMVDFGNILAYARLTTTAALLKFPIQISNTGAENHVEGAPAPAQEEITLGEILVQPEMIKKWISWTDELEIMSAIELGAYLVAEFVEEIVKKIEKDMLYGAMDNKGLQGIVTESIAGGSNRVLTLNANGAVDFTLANTAVGQIRPGANEFAFFMHRETYHSVIANITDTTGRPLYGTDALGRPTYNNVPVFFNDAFPAYDNALPTDAIMMLHTKGAYRVNAPKGLTPVFLQDPYSLATEDRVRLVGKCYLGGTSVRDRGTVVINKGTLVTP